MASSHDKSPDSSHLESNEVALSEAHEAMDEFSKTLEQFSANRTFQGASVLMIHLGDARRRAIAAFAYVNEDEHPPTLTQFTEELRLSTMHILETPPQSAEEAKQLIEWSKICSATLETIRLILLGRTSTALMGFQQLAEDIQADRKDADS